MSCTRTQIINKAREWVGYNEADGSHKKIIDIYNSQTKLPRGYRLKLTDSWCAGFVSALAIDCNATDIIPTEVSCTQMINLAKSMGIWVEEDFHTPASGDLLVYDFEDGEAESENKGAPNHIGIVESIIGDTLTVIEGNYKNAVGIRKVRVNGRYIRGYITPKYDEDVKQEETNVYKEPGAVEIIIKFLVWLVKKIFCRGKKNE